MDEYFALPLRKYANDLNRNSSQLSSTLQPQLSHAEKLQRSFTPSFDQKTHFSNDQNTTKNYD